MMHSDAETRKRLTTSTAIPVALIGACVFAGSSVVASSQESTLIPLEYVFKRSLDNHGNPESNPDGSPNYYLSRLGIWVGINDGAPQRLLFDTGSDQLNAAIGQDANVTDISGGREKYYVYGDGTYGYSFKEVEFDKFTFYDSEGNSPVETISESGDSKYMAAKITHSLYTEDSSRIGIDLNKEDLSKEIVCKTSKDDKYCHSDIIPDNDKAENYHYNKKIQNNIDNGRSFDELDKSTGEYTFSGTFGVGDFLGKDSIQSSILPGMTKSGYIVAANGNSTYEDHDKMPGCSPCAIVDLNSSLRSQFTSVAKWGEQDYSEHVETFPGKNGGNASTQFEGGYTLKVNEGNSGIKTLAVDVPVLLDTGTPNGGTIKMGEATFDALLAAGVIKNVKEKPDDPDQYMMSLTIEAPNGMPVQLDNIDVTRIARPTDPEEEDSYREGVTEFIAGMDFFTLQSVAYDLEKKSTAYTSYFVSADNFSTDDEELALNRVTREMGNQSFQRDRLDENGQPVVGADGETVRDTYGMFGIAGVVSGTGSLTLDPYTDVRMTNINTYTGETVVSENALLSLAGLGSIEQSSRVVVDGNLDISEHGNGNEYWGISDAKNDARIRSLAGNGSVDLGDRTLILTAAGDEFAGAIRDLDANNVSAGGKLSIVGGVQTLSGENTFTGITTVGKGAALLLAETGTLASPVAVSGLFGNDGHVAGATTVGQGGVAAGTGHYGALTVESGGKVAARSALNPGSASSTLTVGGDFVQEAGSAYLLGVGSHESAGRIDVVGKATIDSGAFVELVREDGSNFVVGSRNTILSASQGLDGMYGGLSGGLYADSPFLDFGLANDANTVFLDVDRSAIAFADVGSTFNQISAGANVEALGAGNVVHDGILFMTEGEARGAFDLLSGEVHASLRSILIEDSHFVRDAASDRIRAAFAGVGSSTALVTAYGPHGATRVDPTDEGPVFWGRGFGAWGHHGSNGNAARIDHSVGGFLAGVDAPVGDAWRFGLLAGYSHTSFDIDDRLSSGSSNSYHLGAYGGTQWGNLGFRSGLAYSWNRVETDRRTVLLGFEEHLTSRYNAGTFQTFGELGYRMETASMAFEPYANLAYVHLRGSDFNEGSGDSALAGIGRSLDTVFTTLGVRASSDVHMGSLKASVHGSVAWRHAHGDITPLAHVAFSGGAGFDVKGVPIARNAALLEAGVDMDLMDRATLGLSYQGQIGSSVQQHGFNGKLAVSF